MPLNWISVHIQLGKTVIKYTENLSILHSKNKNNNHKQQLLGMNVKKHQFCSIVSQQASKQKPKEENTSIKPHEMNPFSI